MAGQGPAILNNCKYGHKIVDNTIELNLLRATTSPDPKADRGGHQFLYSFLPHHDVLINSRVLAEAAQLNQQPSIFIGFEGSGLTYPFVLDTEQIVLEVIKKAEKEDATILRLYEPMGRQVNANLILGVEPEAIYERSERICMNFS